VTGTVATSVDGRHSVDITAPEPSAA
jgi:hypothetical protein